MDDLFASVKSPDDCCADNAVAGMARITTVAAFWRAVDDMRGRRLRMDKKASARINAALHRRFEELTGRNLVGDRVEREDAA